VDDMINAGRGSSDEGSDFVRGPRAPSGGSVARQTTRSLRSPQPSERTAPSQCLVCLNRTHQRARLSTFYQNRSRLAGWRVRVLEVARLQPQHGAQQSAGPHGRVWVPLVRVGAPARSRGGHPP
jgi:hypothetical protein